MSATGEEGIYASLASTSEDLWSLLENSQFDLFLASPNVNLMENEWRSFVFGFFSRKIKQVGIGKMLEPIRMLAERLDILDGGTVLIKETETELKSKRFIDWIGQWENQQEPRSPSLLPNPNSMEASQSTLDGVEPIYAEVDESQTSERSLSNETR